MLRFVHKTKLFNFKQINNKLKKKEVYGKESCCYY